MGDNTVCLVESYRSAIVNNPTVSVLVSEEGAAPSTRKAWQTPTIEDADVSAVTEGAGTSGMEGTNFLKPGS